MSFRSKIGRQLRCPTGPVGWIAGRAMRCANARPNVLAVAALDIARDNQALELGCGPGHALRLMAARADRGTVHGLDQSVAMLAGARRANRAAVRSGRVRLYRGRFEALPFADGSIDKILAVNVAYFWHEPGRALSEACRVLRPRGTMVVYVTDAPSIRRWRLGDADTHRFYDRDGLAALLARGGLDPNSVVVESRRILPGVMGLVAIARRA